MGWAVAWICCCAAVVDAVKGGGTAVDAST